MKFDIWVFCEKSVKKIYIVVIQVWLKYDKNSRYFTWWHSHLRCLTEFFLEWEMFQANIYKEPTWCNLAVCLLVTAIMLYMFRHFLFPSPGALRNCSSSVWCTTWDGVMYPRSMASVLSHIVYRTIHNDLVRKPSTLDALIGYLTPSHVVHQTLLLQFLSAPGDGNKKCRNM